MSPRARTAVSPNVQWPLVLHSSAGRARIRPWPHDPSVALLTFVDHGAVPSPTALQVWLDELRARGFTAVRSGAVNEAGADTLRRMRFQVAQRLHLLDLSLVGWKAPPLSPSDSTRVTRATPVHTERLRVRDRARAAEVDYAAFGSPWAMDVVGIGETCAATPFHRARAVCGAQFHDQELVGYAVTGRADRTGYLQRLAVRPEFQGRGAGTTLTRDSLIWMQRRSLTRAVVNTHTDNAIALALYQHFGFSVMPHGLVVMSRNFNETP